MKKCCCDMGNMFFQYINQANKKVYECCECNEEFIIIKLGKTIEIERSYNNEI